MAVTVADLIEALERMNEDDEVFAQDEDGNRFPIEAVGVSRRVGVVLGGLDVGDEG